ncbi:MAG: hypothetical protein U0230_27500 [Polyangiales bacterium]
MEQQSSDELRVLSADASDVGCKVELQVGGERCTFLLAFEETKGIRVMVGADDLCRWLRAHGKLWALSDLRDLAQRTLDGLPVRIPTSLERR